VKASTDARTFLPKKIMFTEKKICLHVYKYVLLQKKPHVQHIALLLKQQIKQFLWKSVEVRQIKDRV
jgi:hypothetical protein